MSLIQDKIRRKDEKLAETKKKIMSDIDKKYRIRSRNHRFK